MAIQPEKHIQAAQASLNRCDYGNAIDALKHTPDDSRISNWLSAKEIRDEVKYQRLCAEFPETDLIDVKRKISCYIYAATRPFGINPALQDNMYDSLRNKCVTNELARLQLSARQMASDQAQVDYKKIKPAQGSSLLEATIELACNLHQALEMTKSYMGKEYQAGAVSGYVSGDELHQLGHNIIDIGEGLAQQEKRYKQLTGKPINYSQCAEMKASLSFNKKVEKRKALFSPNSYEGYVADLTSNVRENWSMAPSAKIYRDPIHAAIRLSIAPNGEIISWRLAQSSGNDEFDQSVLHAISDMRDHVINKEPPLKVANAVLVDGIFLVFESYSKDKCGGKPFVYFKSLSGDKVVSCEL